DTLREGRTPYRALLARVQRFAFREFSRNPALAFADFEKRLGESIFGDAATPAKVKDLLELQRIFTFESDWYWSSPLTDPDFFAARASRLKFASEKLAAYRSNLDQLRTMAQRYRASLQPAEREMA